LIVIYMPFVFCFKAIKKKDEIKEYALNKFLSFTLIIAVLAIFQFVFQFVISGSWLFNIALFLPEQIVSSGNWNTAINAGGFFKANGFFHREPAGLSLLLGFAILLEMLRQRRVRRLAIYGLALILTFSG